MKLLTQNVGNEPVNVITLKWQTLVEKPEGYIVRPYCDDKEDQEHKLPPTVTELTFDRESLPLAWRYRFEIQAFNKAGIGNSVSTRQYEFGTLACTVNLIFTCLVCLKISFLSPYRYLPLSYESLKAN